MQKVIAIAAAIAGVALVWSGASAQEAPVGQPHNWEIWHQPAVTTIGTGLFDFHRLLIYIITGICLLVFVLLAYVIYRFNERRNPRPATTSHNTLLEVAWTILPVLILLVIAVPSFRLLYYADRAPNPEMTLIVHGYQWYWGYEYPDQQIAEFSSYLIPDDQLRPGQPRLLSVDQPVVLPVDTDIQILVTGSDVIHSWSVPAFGVKRDAIPGRMNEMWVRITREGTYYGECYELCGTNHGFMPIEVHAVSRAAFNDWVRQKTADLGSATLPKLLAVDQPAAARPVLASSQP